MNLKISKISKNSRARSAILKLSHGNVKTPFFMPIATAGAVKTIAVDDLISLEAEIVLANAYHLSNNPGMTVITAFNGLHAFMGWNKPILTDSGGFQVFSLSKFIKISDQGVIFREPKSGNKLNLTPEKAISIQTALGSDIMMPLDLCCSFIMPKKTVAEAVETTTKWAKRSLSQKEKLKNKNLLFGIVQGGADLELRKKSMADLTALDFDGFALGGLAVGEPRQKMKMILRRLANKLPADKPRYLMGVGYPEEIVWAVKCGIDMFDCVLPTRNARHGALFVYRNKLLAGKFYKIINISNKKYASDTRPIDKTCGCCACRRYSRGYLRHLFKIKEPLGQRLATLHNINFYLELMKRIRSQIIRGVF